MSPKSDSLRTGKHGWLCALDNGLYGSSRHAQYLSIPVDFAMDASAEAHAALFAALLTRLSTSKVKLREATSSATACSSTRNRLSGIHNGCNQLLRGAEWRLPDAVDENSRRSLDADLSTQA